MSITYSYNDDSGKIDNKSILQETNKGILQSYGEYGFKYIPQENIEKEIESVTGVYKISKENEIYHRPYISNLLEFSSINNDNTFVTTKVKYAFGINKLETKHIKNYNVCGYISEDIEISSCSYIKLSVKGNNDISGLEFYIIDNSKESPILPIETDIVKDEKIFFGMDTRFNIDTTKDITIKKDGEIFSSSLTDLNELDSSSFAKSIYTIDYVPIVQQHLYYPESSFIKVKIIQRCYASSAIPIDISSISILKYGGNKIWNI